MIRNTSCVICSNSTKRKIYGIARMKGTGHSRIYAQRSSIEIPDTTINHKLRRFVQRVARDRTNGSRGLTRRDINQSPNDTRKSRSTTIKVINTGTNTKVLHGHTGTRTTMTISTVNDKAIINLSRPRKMAEEQFILNIPTNSSGSEFSTTTKIPGHPRSGNTRN